MYLLKKLEKKLYVTRDIWKEEYYECVKDIVNHPVVLRMKLYPHHGTTNCYQHCMHVSFYTYQLCRLFHLNARSAARGSMLHDLFLYDWHTHYERTGQHFHGLTHPKVAYENANKFFKLDSIEKDIILNHMWPITPFSIPKTREGWVITLTDKYCGACETSQRRKKMISVPVRRG
ncbi:MAG: phosphohydrolase [Hespellia sp.]|nr:phosphohydrolase [Hespellia sp.]